MAGAEGQETWALDGQMPYQPLRKSKEAVEEGEEQEEEEKEEEEEEEGGQDYEAVTDEEEGGREEVEGRRGSYQAFGWEEGWQTPPRELQLPAFARTAPLGSLLARVALNCLVLSNPRAVAVLWLRCTPAC